MKRILIVLTAGMLLFACNSNTKTEPADESATPAVAADWEVVTLPVNGMTCEGCENAIKAGVESLEGIASVESSHEEGWTKVKFDKNRTSVAEITGKITETGYGVEDENSKEAL